MDSGPRDPADFPSETHINDEVFRDAQPVRGAIRRIGRPSVFALSIMAHAAVVGLVYFGMTHPPRIEDPRLLQRFSVRQLTALARSGLSQHAPDPRAGG